jgi:hypothetical protein
MDVARVFTYAETASPAQSQPVISLGCIKDIEPRLHFRALVNDTAG